MENNTNQAEHSDQYLNCLPSSANIGTFCLKFYITHSRHPVYRTIKGVHYEFHRLQNSLHKLIPSALQLDMYCFSVQTQELIYFHSI